MEGCKTRDGGKGVSYPKINSDEAWALTYVASALDANPQDLYDLIDFESGWNPQIKNPRSSARGLVQFMDETAKGMGYLGSADLIAKHPTRVAQLQGPVLAYLKQWAPYKQNKQALFMAVFYPAARFWNPEKCFPEWVQNANPGIDTVSDYMAFATGKKNSSDQSQTEKAGLPTLMVGTLLMSMPSKVAMFAGGALIGYWLWKR